MMAPVIKGRTSLIRAAVTGALTPVTAAESQTKGMIVAIHHQKSEPMSKAGHPCHHV